MCTERQVDGPDTHRHQLKVGLHCLGYVAPSSRQAADEFYPGYARMVDTLGKERGWPPSSRSQFNAQLRSTGAFLIGSAEEVADKIVRHSEALGGVSRVTFQMIIRACRMTN